MNRLAVVLSLLCMSQAALAAVGSSISVNVENKMPTLSRINRYVNFDINSDTCKETARVRGLGGGDFQELPTNEVSAEVCSRLRAAAALQVVVGGDCTSGTVEAKNGSPVLQANCTCLSIKKQGYTTSTEILDPKNCYGQMNNEQLKRLSVLGIFENW